VTISDNCHSGSGGVIIVIVMLAELERGGSSVARVGESPTTSSPKIIARSEAKHRKRSLFMLMTPPVIDVRMTQSINEHCQHQDDQDNNIRSHPPHHTTTTP